MARCAGCGFEGEETEWPGMGVVSAGADTRTDALYCDDCQDATYSVYDADTADRLEGGASWGLVDASLSEKCGGAVPAYKDDDGVWHYVRPDMVEHYRLHETVKTVYVMED